MAEKKSMSPVATVAPAGVAAAIFSSTVGYALMGKASIVLVGVRWWNAGFNITGVLTDNASISQESGY